MYYFIVRLVSRGRRTGASRMRSRTAVAWILAEFDAVFVEGLNWVMTS